MLNRIRGHFAFFGFDVSDLTDEELEAGILEASRRIGNAGVTVEEAGRALSTFGGVKQP